MYSPTGQADPVGKGTLTPEQRQAQSDLRTKIQFTTAELIGHLNDANKNRETMPGSTSTVPDPDAVAKTLLGGDHTVTTPPPSSDDATPAPAATPTPTPVTAPGPTPDASPAPTSPSPGAD